MPEAHAAQRSEVTKRLLSAGCVVRSEIWHCYMVRCKDDSLYVGIATDIEDRVKRHNWGVGPEFTARRTPVQLVWSERCGDSKAARRREKEIKGWSRRKKLALMSGDRQV